MKVYIGNLCTLIFVALLYGCSAHQSNFDSKDNVSGSSIPYKLEGFGSCPLSESDVELLVSIKKGTVEPNISVPSPERVALNPQDINTWRATIKTLENYFPPLVFEKDNPRPVFIAVFDGTWNDRKDLDGPLTVPARLSYELEELAKTEELMVVKYYNGVGTRVSPYKALLHGITGEGTIDRAELALKDFREAVQIFDEKPNVYTIGFSRGAASARHFLNLVDPMLSIPSEFRDLKLDRSRSFALLFDTVATGQLKNLNLDIPLTTASTLHLVATEEKRISFPYVTVLNDSKNGSDPNLVVELSLPAVHSNLGGGYGSGLELISYDVAKRWLFEQGFSLSLSEIDMLSILNEGRHDSDWVFTSFAHGLLNLMGKSERHMIEPISVHDHELTFEKSFVLRIENFNLMKKSAISRLERLESNSGGGQYFEEKFISLRYMRNGDVFFVYTNCPEYISFDSKSKMLMIDDYPFFSVRKKYEKLKSTVGFIHTIYAEKAANFRDAR